VTSNNVSQEISPRKSTLGTCSPGDAASRPSAGTTLRSRERYAAKEHGITERLQRKSSADRAVADAIEQAQRQIDHVVDVARWRSTEDLGHVAASLGYSGLADWFSRDAPGGDYPTWCAEQCRAAYADTARDRRTDPVGFSTRFTDIEIEQGRLDASARQTAIEYSTLCMAGRHVEAAVYLKQLRQHRAPVRRIPRRAGLSRSPRRRTASTSVRRATADSGGDSDPEPPRPRARGPPPRAWPSCAQGPQFRPLHDATPEPPEVRFRGPGGRRGLHPT
jgi:hypothetical protein